MDESNPGTYLLSTSYEMSKDSADREDAMRFAAAYADCAEEYFDTFASELLELRPEVVERNREVLERFAAEVSAAGYVP